MKFKAAVLVESKKPLVIDEIESAPLRFGQILVKLYCSGICGAQINEIDAVKGPDAFLPHLLGHEGTGLVVDCGEGVTTVAPGNRVVLHWRKGSGIQAPTPTYKSDVLGKINAGWVTTFNEYAVVSENRVTAIPDDFDVEYGALMGCAVTTAFGTLNNDARLCIGESIAIFGAGGVGLSMVQGAAMTSAYPIIAIDLYDNRLELARQLGATHIVNSRNQDPETEIRKIVGNQGVDVAVDNTGVPEVVELAYQVTNQQGRTLLVGVMTKGQSARIHTYPLHFDQKIIGSSGGQCRPEIDINNYVRLCKAGKLDFEHLITRRYALDQINDAIEDLRDGTLVGRCMIKMSNE